MHVLPRPHDLRRAVLAAVAAAVLAIVLTLASTGRLSDLSSAPTAAGVPSSHAALQASAISPQTSSPFTHSPFTNPFTAPIRLPWASGRH